jgi:hypothetical protein
MLKRLCFLVIISLNNFSVWSDSFTVVLPLSSPTETNAHDTTVTDVRETELLYNKPNNQNAGVTNFGFFTIILHRIIDIMQNNTCADMNKKCYICWCYTF